MKRISITLLALATLVFSCKKDKDAIHKGPVVQVHNGKAWTWVEVNKDNVPQRLGITIDDAAMNSVPTGNVPPGHEHENNYILQLPAEGSTTPFKHVWLNWNPAGHEPDQVYTIPHFDIHYYTITNAEREAMVNATKMEIHPAADYVPANHIAPGTGIPTMGKHWLDPTSPELAPGGTFTQTFLFGSYDGKMVFYEPMITKTFLQQNSNFERTIPQPAKFREAGYYPTKMRVVKHDAVTEIILDGLVYRQAS
jgi:hypothetical protein